MNYKGKIRNIVIVTPSLSGGGAEKVAANIGNLFIKNGFKVSIICIYKKGNLSYKIDKNINQVYLNSKKISSSLLKLRKIFNDYNPSIIISFLTITNIFISLSRIFQKKRHLFIYTQHEIPSKTFNKIFKLSNSFIVPILMKQTYKYADKIVCVSHGLENELKELFNNKINHKITTIYNLVYKEPKNVIKKSYFKNGVSLLSVGRLVPNKNFKNLINAVNLLKEKIDFSLKIVGQGEQRENLLALIKKNNLEKRCRIYDFVENLTPFYLESDIYISSSLHESFGNTLIEAMHYHMLIISTDCPYGPREILDNGNLGELVSENSPNELANAILKAAKTKVVPNYKKIIVQCNPESVLDKYKNLFEELQDPNRYKSF